jgi:TonB family protein
LAAFACFRDAPGINHRRKIMKVLIFVLTLLLSSEIAYAVDLETFEKSYLINPELKEITPPVYPSLALQFALQGTVEVMLWIDSEGKPAGARIVRSSSVLFEKPALSAALKSRFSPAIDAGYQRVPSVVRIPFVFRLR